MKDNDVVVVTSGRTHKNEDGLFIEGTVVNGITNAYNTGSI